MGILDRAVSCDNFRRCLFTHARDSRNIIRGISHQGFQFNDLRRRHLIRLEYFFRVIIFHLCLSAFGLRNPYQYMIGGKLQKIPVTRQDRCIHPLLFRQPGNGSQQIICLVSFLRDNSHTHRCQNLFDQRNLFPQFFRHRFSRSFVSIIHFMTERRSMKVECNCQIFRFFFL